jgi:hypothetical protein
VFAISIAEREDGGEMGGKYEKRESVSSIHVERTISTM